MSGNMPPGYPGNGGPNAGGWPQGAPGSPGSPGGAFPGGFPGNIPGNMPGGAPAGTPGGAGAGPSAGPSTSPAPMQYDIYGQPIGQPAGKKKKKRRKRPRPQKNNAMSKRKRTAIVSASLVAVVLLGAVAWATDGFGLWAYKAQGAFSQGIGQAWSHKLDVPKDDRISAAARFTPYSVTTADYSTITTVVPRRQGAQYFSYDTVSGKATEKSKGVSCDTLQACMPDKPDPAIIAAKGISINKKTNPKAYDAMDRVLWGDKTSGVILGASTIDGSTNGLVTTLLAYSVKDNAIIWTREVENAGRALVVPGGIVITYTDPKGDAYVDYYSDKAADQQQVKTASGKADAKAITRKDFGKMRWTFLGNQSVNLINSTGFFSVDIKEARQHGRYVNFASATPADGTQIAVDDKHGQIDYDKDRTLYADVNGDSFIDALTFVKVKQPFSVGKITLKGQPNTKESTSEFGYVWTWENALGTAEMIPDPIYHFISNDTYLADPTKAGAKASKIEATKESFIVLRDSSASRSAGFAQRQEIKLVDGELVDIANNMWGGSCMNSDVGNEKSATYSTADSVLYSSPVASKPVSVSHPKLVTQSAVFITDLADASMRIRHGRALVGVGNGTMGPACYWRGS